MVRQMASIHGINLSSIGNSSLLNEKKTESDGGAFKDMLTNAIAEADNLYAVSQNDTQALLSGEVDDLAQVMINSTKSEMALNMVVQVRNRVVDAYNEIMRMQL